MFIQRDAQAHSESLQSKGNPQATLEAELLAAFDKMLEKHQGRSDGTGNRPAK